MTSATLEPDVIDPESTTVALEDFEFEILCDIAGLQAEHPNRIPICHGDAAKWVAWRPNCCGGTRYRLICDRCKKVYQAWAARQAYITCMDCGAETGGFIAYTPLEKRS